jgi:adenylate cyclase
MAVAGVPTSAADHAGRIARLALDMQIAAEATSRQFGIALRLRIGIARGPVMAGIIGKQKFSYDVWGDAVNLASRLEHSGKEGRIHVSTEVRQALLQSYEFAPAGTMHLKGFGDVETWFLIGPRQTSGACTQSTSILTLT